MKKTNRYWAGFKLDNKMVRLKSRFTNEKEYDYIEVFPIKKHAMGIYNDVREIRIIPVQNKSKNKKNVHVSSAAGKKV